MSAELAIVAPGALDEVSDPGKFVELACERAKEWLAQALEHGDIDGIVELKSQAEAIRTYTVQKQLGKDAELSAAEIVRRAERGLGLAVRRGQAEGTVNTSEDGPAIRDLNREPTKISTKEIWPNGHTEERRDSYVMASVSDEQFEDAIAQAKDERNLARSNVVRKVALTKIGAVVTDHSEHRVVKARRMAAEGYTSRQIGEAIGIKNMGDFRDRHGIEVPADAAVGKTRRHDSNRIVSETVATCEALVIGLQLVDVDDLDRDQLEGWATSLSDSLRHLNRLSKQLKEMTL